MKIVYVGDNRNRGNFGCRATSTALSQIISKNNEIVGRVYGKYTNVDTGELFFYQYLPSFVYKFLGKLKNWQKLKSGLYLFIRFLKRGKYYFSNFDFVDYDFDKSINNLIKCLPANPHLKEFDLRQYDFDALVVNGEGSFIFATPPWRECLVEAMLMHWAEKLGKKVYYLNGMLSDDPYSNHNEKTIDIIKPIFEKAVVVSVREDFSYDYAKNNFKDINLVKYPDALFTWYDYVNDNFHINNGKYVIGMSGACDETFENIDFSKPYICVSGSSSVGLAANSVDEAVEVYSNLVDELKNSFSMNIFLVEVCEGDNFLRKVAEKTKTNLIPIDTPILSAAKILANAQVYVSGRYHPSILASLGGTPCVFMSSNSHKTLSIQKLLKYEDIKEFSVMPDKKERKLIIDCAKKKVKAGKELREIIKNRCKELSIEAKSQIVLLEQKDNDEK